MHIGRLIIIPTLLTLSVAGTTLAVAGTPAAARHVSHVQVHSLSMGPGPDIYNHA
jgi:hypothetical protein